MIAVAGNMQLSCHHDDTQFVKVKAEALSEAIQSWLANPSLEVETAPHKTHNHAIETIVAPSVISCGDIPV